MTAVQTDSLNKKIAASKLKLLADQNIVTFLASNIVVPSTVATLLFLIGNANPKFVIIWLVTGFFIGLARAIHHLKLKNFEGRDRPIKRWEYEFIALSMISGCFWSACGILFLEVDNAAQSLVVISALLGVMSGAVAALASHTKVFLSFVLFTWIPSGIYFFALGDPLHLGVGVLGTLFLVIVISFSKSQSRSVDLSLRLRYENIELLEELKVQKQKAEDANMAKSRFLAVASHDLRQPIHAMRLFSDSLASRITDDASSSIMKMLRSSIETLSGLFDSLLDISKLDAEAIEPQIHKVDVSNLIKNLSTEFSAQCFDKGLRCVYKCNSQFFIASDPVLLERILRNLIWNAIKFTSKGGILIAARKRGGKLRIEVWDSGCGIPADETSKIFTEFHQVERQDQDAREGIGLGLSIVNRLCHLLGYNVSLRSMPGHGSVFFVEMPLADYQDLGAVDEQDTSNEVTATDTDLSGVQVLVVDDEAGIRSAMKHILEDWGCIPTIVESDKQATQALEQFTPDIILTDFHLKNSVSGDKVIQLIQEEVGYEIPSMIITGDTSPENLTTANASCDVLMHKPIKPDILQKNIIRLLNEQTPID